MRVVYINTGAWIFLGVVCALLIIGIVITYKVKRKIRDFSQQAFGTDNLLEGYKQTKESLAETPRSLHAMTNALLPAISRDFPEFDYAQFRQKAENMLRAYFNSIEAKNLRELEAVSATDSIKDKVQGIISDLASMNRTQHFDEVTIHKTELSNYETKKGYCVITLESAVGLYDFITDENDKVVGGDKSLKRQTVYSQELIYIQDPDKMQQAGFYSSISLSCPNCGAPIKKLGTKFCEYCGSGVKEINIRSWSFNDIKELNTQTKKYY